MAKDRVARQTNREQTSRLDADEGRLALLEDLQDQTDSRLDLIEANVTTLALRLDNLSARVAALEPPPPPPPPPPPTGQKWKQFLLLDTVAKWAANGGVLTEAPGSTITAETEGGLPFIRLSQPKAGERCELQVFRRELTPHSLVRYSWWFRIPEGTLLPKRGDDNTICQQHGNNNAGYTGGITIREPTNRIAVRVKGGEQLSSAGSHRYEYESDRGIHAVPEGSDEFGTVTYGEWHQIVYEAKWSTEWDGYVRCSLDGGPVTEIANVPTMSEIADVVMGRVGWYPGGAIRGPLVMDVKNYVIEVPA